MATANQARAAAFVAALGVALLRSGVSVAHAPYLADGSYLADEQAAAAVFESRDWTDYVLISAIRE